MRRALLAGLAVAGAAAVSVGAGMLLLPAGVIVGGLFALAGGLLIEDGDGDAAD